MSYLKNSGDETIQGVKQQVNAARVLLKETISNGVSSMQRGLIRSGIVFAIFFIASPAHAQVEITEVMYDLEGGDSGREWIEVVATAEVADLSLWKFLENGTNHGLTLIQGNADLSSGARAIIADNANTFLSDNPGFSGALFDSSFSLKNTGEYIAMKDAEGNEVSGFTYDPNIGAAGDGNSLQKVSGSWGTGLPTPGSGNGFSEPEVVPGSEESTEQSATTNSSGGNSAPVVEETISANAGETRRTVLVGGQVLFQGEGFGIKGAPLSSARYSWTFGDGARGDGQKIFHTYKVPGEYVAVLNVSSGKLTAADRVYVTAIPADFALSFGGEGADSFIEVKNNTPHELDLSGWSLQSGGTVFYIPDNTFVLSKGSISFPHEYTEIYPNVGSVAVLHYPNGREAASSHIQVVQDTNPVVSQVETVAFVSEQLPPVAPVGNIAQKQREDIVPEKEIVVDGQEALIIGVLEEKQIPLYIWIMGLITVCVAGITGVLLSKSTRPEVQEYKIVEVEEIDSNT